MVSLTVRNHLPMKNSHWGKLLVMLKYFENGLLWHTTDI